jgi:threonine dehydrogenase-like Zn-dependent dehydrogenase
MYAAGDFRVEHVPDAAIVEPTDAVVRVTRACIGGSDLWPYASMERSGTGQSMGHEAIGVVEDIGSQVTKSKKGDVVVMPFAFSDGTCTFCHEGPADRVRARRLPRQQRRQRRAGRGTAHPVCRRDAVPASGRRGRPASCRGC